MQDITEVEFLEFLQRCGIIAEDDDGYLFHHFSFAGNKKVKLYRDEHGNLKGDGRCCYLKVASVPLALQLLDGSDLRGHKVQVTRVSLAEAILTIFQAVFQAKADYVAQKKPKGKKKKKGTQNK
jgi:HIV Tat-specific factor 1